MKSLVDDVGCLGDYGSLLELFRERGYRTASFFDFRPKADLLLRHDIDFDPRCALKTAEIERRMDFTATYFFMVSAFSYNIFSTTMRQAVTEIRDMGHWIRLHFDPLPHEDLVQGFRSERRQFEQVFEVPVDIVSIHRPNDFFLSGNELLDGVPHTYMNAYFKDIQYCSDSQGRFRYGHPADTSAFQSGDTIHLLTHPVWWTIEAADNVGVLELYRSFRSKEFQQDIGRNCIPYSEWMNFHEADRP